MNHPDLTVSNLMGKFIGLQRENNKLSKSKGSPRDFCNKK